MSICQELALPLLGGVTFRSCGVTNPATWTGLFPGCLAVTWVINCDNKESIKNSTQEELLLTATEHFQLGSLKTSQLKGFYSLLRVSLVTTTPSKTVFRCNDLFTLKSILSHAHPSWQSVLAEKNPGLSTTLNYILALNLPFTKKKHDMTQMSKPEENCLECFASSSVPQVILSVVPQTFWDQTQFHWLTACPQTARPELLICNLSSLLLSRTSGLWAKANAAFQAVTQQKSLMFLSYQNWNFSSLRNILKHSI